MRNDQAAHFAYQVQDWMYTYLHSEPPKPMTIWGFLFDRFFGRK